MRRSFAKMRPEMRRRSLEATATQPWFIRLTRRQRGFGIAADLRCEGEKDGSITGLAVWAVCRASVMRASCVDNYLVIDIRQVIIKSNFKKCLSTLLT